MKIKREDFLKKLELVQFGVPARETVNFSKTFIFLDGEVCTYDDEILCRIPLYDPKDSKKQQAEWKKIEGAVEAQRLLGILRKIPDVEVDIEQKGGEFFVFGADSDEDEKEASFKMERIEGQDLPSNQVEKPKEFWKLPEKFGEAIKVVQDCAKEKDSVFARTCVYLSPDYIQAYDNFQVIRLYMKNEELRDKLNNEVEEDREESGEEDNEQNAYVLIRKSAIKNIAALPLEYFSITDCWVHFSQGKGKGLTYSCRKWLEPYPDAKLTEELEAEGREITLPQGLEAAIDAANEFSQEHADANRVIIELTGRKVIVTGQGITGRYYQKVRASEDSNEEFSFLISPTLLTSIVKKNTKILLSPSTLIVEGNSEGFGWKYLALLVSPDEVDMSGETEEEEEGVTVEEEEEYD